MNIAQSILNALNRRSPAQITICFLHHSDADPGTDIEELAYGETHRGIGPFATIGYNAVCKRVDKDRDLWVMQQGRPLTVIPAAQYGMNTEGYAICLGGRYQPGAEAETDVVSEHALKVIAAQILLVKAKCPNLYALGGHRDVAKIKAAIGYNAGDFSTACPGDRAYSALDHLCVMTGLRRLET